MFEKVARIQIVVFAIILGLSLIFAFVFGAKLISNNFSKDEITVTGSASEIVTSDSGVWRFQIKTESLSRAEGYRALSSQKPVVIQFLKSKGIKDNEIEFLGMNNYAKYKTSPNGYSTQEIAGYTYEQTVKINSKDVELIKKLHLEIPSLIEKGIVINSFEPNYLYSGLADKKAELLQKATADAKFRAKEMLRATGNRVGKIRSVRMGVFQITPPDSNEVSDWGINDTSSIEKKVTAVSNVVFGIR